MHHCSVDCMEKVQFPHFGSSSQAAETFYQRKMSVTPCGVVDEVDGTGITYLFSEQAGKMNSNHMVNILEETVDKMKEKSDSRHFKLNLDNCAVNKCYLVLRWVADLLVEGLYDTAEIHFMVAGHTKFGPDRMFGWLTSVVNNSDLFELDDVAKAVAKARVAYFKANKKEHPYDVVIVDSFSENGKSYFFSDFKEYYDGSYSEFGTISKLHRLKFEKVDDTPILFAKEFSEDETWTRIDFVTNYDINKGLNELEKVALKPAKLADLQKQLKFIPGGVLSYVPPIDVKP